MLVEREVPGNSISSWAADTIEEFLGSGYDSAEVIIEGVKWRSVYTKLQDTRRRLKVGGRVKVAMRSGHVFLQRIQS